MTFSCQKEGTSNQVRALKLHRLAILVECLADQPKPFSNQDLWLPRSADFTEGVFFQEVASLARQEKADIVLFGHSHTFSSELVDGTWYINPGSAGPARFKLKRTAAILTLPEKVERRDRAK